MEAYKDNAADERHNRRTYVTQNPVSDESVSVGGTDG